MNEQELKAWAISAGYWVDDRVPHHGLNERNLRKQSKRVLALIAEVRRGRKYKEAYKAAMDAKNAYARKMIRLREVLDGTDE